MAASPERLEAAREAIEHAQRGRYARAREILISIDLPGKAESLPIQDEKVALQFGYH